MSEYHKSISAHLREVSQDTPFRLNYIFCICYNNKTRYFKTEQVPDDVIKADMKIF